MLTSMRKGAASWFSRIFLLILVLSFVVWGVADFLTSQAEQPLAEVAGSAITAQEFDNEFRRELFQLQQQLGPDFDTAKAREAGFDREVLRQMLVGIMYDLEATHLSLTTADQTIAQSILENPAYRDSFGQFDRNLFQSTLRNAGFTEKEFMRRARQDLTRRQLITAIGAGAVAPAKMGEALYGLRSEQRAAELLFIPQSAAGKIADPADAELEAFHKDNAALFTAPELRSISYVTLHPEDLAAGITLDEKELRENYETRLAEFTVSGMRNLQQFVMQDEAAAKAAAEKIIAGADFASVAKQAAGITADALDLKEITKNQLPAEIADAAFALKEGEVSQPLKSPFGWHVIKVTLLREERIEPFDEVRSRLIKDLSLSRAIDLAVERANQLEDARAGGASLEEAAKEFSLPIRTLTGIDRNGNAADGKPAANLPADPQFLTDIFDTDEGSESDLRENKEGGYYVLRVDSVAPSALRPLNEVRADVIAAWRAQKTGEKLHTLATDMLNAVNAGKSLSDAGKALKLKPAISAPFARDFTDERMSANLVAKLFAAKAGDAFGEPVATGGYVIARLRDVTPPDVAAQRDAVTKMTKEISQNIAQDVLSQYQAVLERRYEVKINQDRLTSLFDEQQ